MREVFKYLWNILVWIDQGLNTLLGGDPDETLSSRMGKAIRENRCVLCKWMCRFLDLFETNHCEKSIEKDEGKNEV